MSDLREAAQMALDALDIYREHNEENIGLADAAYEALRQALAQPEQEREWVGLTWDEIDYCFESCVVRKFSQDGKEEGCVNTHEVAKAIEAKLKEKNT